MKTLPRKFKNGFREGNDVISVYTFLSLYNVYLYAGTLAKSAKAAKSE